MAAREPAIITLGGRVHKVRPLTVTQIEMIEAVLAKPPKSNARQASDIIAAGLSRDHADIDIEDAGATVVELGDAMQELLKLGGFIPPGEAPAAAGNAGPTGGKSEVGSRHPSPRRRPK